MKKAKKKVKVRDMKPKKDAKGGSFRNQRAVLGAQRTSLR
jgi:hypothetical protein